jgi:hypothetical protein
MTHPATAPVAALPPDHADAELIRACAQHGGNRAAYNASNEADAPARAPDGPCWTAYTRTSDLISSTTPQTFAGILAKARTAVEEGDEGAIGGDWGDTAPSRWAADVCRALVDMVDAEARADAALVSLAAEIVSLETDFKRLVADPASAEDAATRATRAASAKIRQLAALPARTPEGVRAKGRALAAFYGADMPDPDMPGGILLASLLADLTAPPAPEATPQPAPAGGFSVEALGRQIAEIYRTQRAYELATGKTLIETMPERMQFDIATHAALGMFGIRIDAIHELIATLGARNLADSAVQIATINELANMLADFENSPSESRLAGMKIRRMARGILPIVARAAGLDVAEMEWTQVAELGAIEFAGVGG